MSTNQRPVVLFTGYDCDIAFGVRNLYAALRHAGFESRVISLGLARQSPNLEERLLTEPLDFDTPTRIPAPDREEIAQAVEAVRQIDPCLVGLSVISSHYAMAVEVSRALRRAVNVPIVWGGFHPTFEPEESLRDSGADAVCVGEGEDAIVELASRAAGGSRDCSGIGNVWRLDASGRLIREELRPLRPSLDAIPFIPISAGDMLRIPGDMREQARREVSRIDGDMYTPYAILGSYGCPYRCTFCFNEPMRELYRGEGRYIRRKCVERVIEEARYGRDVLGKRFIAFWDDIFTLNRGWLEEFSARYPREVGLPFYCYFHPLHASEELIGLVKKAGGASATCGVQSGSERYRREYLNRQESNEQIVEAAKRLNPRIVANYDMLIDLPFETDEDRRENVRLFLRFPLPFSIMMNSYVCVPGCSLTRRALESGRIRREDLVWKQSRGWDMMDYWQKSRSPVTQNLLALLNLTQYAEFSREEIAQWLEDEEILRHPYRLRFTISLRLLEKARRELNGSNDRVGALERKVAELEARTGNPAVSMAAPIPPSERVREMVRRGLGRVRRSMGAPAQPAVAQVRRERPSVMGPPVVLITLYDGQMNCSMRFLYGCLVGSGHAARVIRFGVTLPYEHSMDYSLFQTLKVKFPTVRPPPADGDVRRLEEIIRELNPCWVGFNVIAPHNHVARRLTERLRKVTSAPIVWGGFAVIDEPEWGIQHADVVCTGEGEQVVVELTAAIKAGRREFPDIPGIWYRDGSGGIVRNSPRRYMQASDLDSIPLIHYERTLDEVLIPWNALEHYGNLPKADGGRGNSADVVHDVIFSRGCPLRCHFCGQNAEHERSAGRGAYYRAPSPEWVVEFLKDAKYRLKKQRFLIWDELFPTDGAWVGRFSRLYKREIGLPFSVNFHPQFFREDNLEALLDAGMDSCNMGLQSGSERVRRECYGRRESNRLILENARIINPRLLVCYDYIVDNPWETVADLREALDLFLEMPHPYILDTNTLLFFAKSAITRRALEQGLIGEEQILGRRDHPGPEDVTCTPFLPRADPAKRAVMMLIVATQYPFLTREELAGWSRDRELLRDDRFLAAILLQRLYRHTRGLMYEYEWEMETLSRQARGVPPSSHPGRGLRALLRHLRRPVG